MELLSGSRPPQLPAVIKPRVLLSVWGCPLPAGRQRSGWDRAQWLEGRGPAWVTRPASWREGKWVNGTDPALLSQAGTGRKATKKQLTRFLVWGSLRHSTGGPKWTFKHLGGARPSGKVVALRKRLTDPWWQAPDPPPEDRQKKQPCGNRSGDWASLGGGGER